MVWKSQIGIIGGSPTGLKRAFSQRSRLTSLSQHHNKPSEAGQRLKVAVLRFLILPMAILTSYPNDSDYELIQKAAKLKGISVSAFVVSAVIPEARRTVQSLTPEAERELVYRAIVAGRWKAKEIAQLLHWKLDRVQVALEELVMEGRLEEGESVKGKDCGQRGELVYRPVDGG